jgi:hypothetical protein
MELASLKSSINQYIASTEDEKILNIIHNILINNKEASQSIWNNLTTSQQQKILLSYDTIENENQLIEFDQIFK